MKNRILSLLALGALLFPSAANAQATSGDASKYKQFIPKGYVINAEYKLGDLNKDGISDAVIIIKNTLQSAWETDNSGEKVDRNRRGIIVLFGKANGGYTKAAENKNCFESDKEDGGVYFAPEMAIEESANHNLIVEYSHGRYGSWQYVFRYQNGGFKLIGFDRNECRGPITESITSLNFLTKKKQVKTNTMSTDRIIQVYGEELNGYKEKFKEKWSKLPNKPLIDLVNIKSFDELDIE